MKIIDDMMISGTSVLFSKSELSLPYWWIGFEDFTVIVESRRMFIITRLISP